MRQQVKKSERKKGKTTLRLFPWLEIRGVPCEIDPELGELISAPDLKKAELQAAHIIVSQPLPLTGKVVRFVRSLLGYSLQRMADEFELSAPGILKWEAVHGDELLSIPNALAFRVWAASKLKVDINVTWEQFVVYAKATNKTTSIKFKETA